MNQNIKFNKSVNVKQTLTIFIQTFVKFKIRKPKQAKFCFNNILHIYMYIKSLVCLHYILDGWLLMVEKDCDLWIKCSQAYINIKIKFKKLNNKTN